jgi:hypothetical protein
MVDVTENEKNILTRKPRQKIADETPPVHKNNPINSVRPPEGPVATASSTLTTTSANEDGEQSTELDSQISDNNNNTNAGAALLDAAVHEGTASNDTPSFAAADGASQSDLPSPSGRQMYADLPGASVEGARNASLARPLFSGRPASSNLIEIEFSDTGPAGPDASKRAFRFNVDRFSDEEIAGWIMAPQDPMRRFTVALKEGDNVLARTMASRHRADLVSAGLGDGCYSFMMPIPQSLMDGREHLLELVEDETGSPLSPQPIRWRSAATALLKGPTDRATSRILGPNMSPATERELPVNLRLGFGYAPSVFPDLKPLASSKNWANVHGQVGTRVLIDISDLVYYIGHHANLTGIQRVQSSIVLSILRHSILPRTQLIFLSFNARTRNWVAVPTPYLFTLLEDLVLTEAQRVVAFPAEEARYGLLPGATEFNGVGVLDDGNPSVLCLLGAAWVNQDYIHRVLALKRQFGTRFVMTVHDLIPIYARDTCDQDTARVFEEFMRRALPHVDHALSVSENTAKDLRRYADYLQIQQPPTTVTCNGSSFTEFLPQRPLTAGSTLKDLPERFVLGAARR